MTQLNKLAYFQLVISWIIITISVKIVLLRPEVFPYIFLMDVWLFSHPHAVSTLFKKNVFERLTKKHLFFITSSLATGMGLIIWKFGHVTLFNVYFFAQWFHYLRQNYGISISYYQKSTRGDYLFQKALFHLLPVVALGYLGANGPINFLGYFIYFPEFSIEIASGLNTIYLIVLPLWCFNELIKYKRNQFNLLYATYFISNYILYYWAYIYMNSFVYGWLGLTFYHNVQYIIFAWKDRCSEIKEIQFHKYYGLITCASLLIYGVIELGNYAVYFYAIPITLVATLTVNFTHYVYDSFIWRASSSS